MSRTWLVDWPAQREFAALSGDHNPIHVDPIAARRLPFGRPAVHGMHLVLDSLDALDHGVPRRVRSTFRHSIGVDDEIITSVESTGTSTSMRVGVDVWVAADIDVDQGDPFVPSASPGPPPSDGDPAEWTLDQLTDMSGEIDVALDSDLATARFPNLVERIGIGPVAELTSLTRLVGMHVPGLHSMFSTLDVTFRDADRSSAGLRYRVVSTDDRFSSVRIEVVGPSLEGRVTAFVRPAPVSPTIDTTIGGAGIATHEFADRRALVIGGSRGLGAAAVQVLAAGGADVRFTYLRGEADASDLTAATGATSFRLDVLDPDQALSTVVADGWRPTDLAYFATPPIFDGVHGVWSDDLFHRFERVYVDAFAEIVERLGTDGLERIVWPSSEAAGQAVRGLAEYGEAKRRGEDLCRRLAAAHPHVDVRTPRFPRLPTDQSSSYLPTEFGDLTAEITSALRDTTA